MARIDYKGGRFLGIGTWEERKLWEKAGFTFSKPHKAWITEFAEVAERVEGVEWTQAALDHQGGLQWVARTSREMSYADTTAFRPPVPPGNHPRTGLPFEFLGYQAAGIEFALAHEDVLVADAPGLGKTVQGIGLSNCLPEARRILVVAPASLKANWLREWTLWDTKGLTVGIAETSHKVKVPVGHFKNGRVKYKTVVQAEFFPDTEVVIVNPDILHRFENEIKTGEWDLLVVDEAHSLKSEESNRTLFILGGRRKEKREGCRKKSWYKYEPIRAKRRCFLTGTPILNRPVELWPIIHAFDPKGLGLDWEKYVYYFCGAWWDPFRGKWGSLDTSGATNKAELGQKLREAFMIRRLKKDVLKDLPDKSRHVVLLDSPDIRALVQQETELAEMLRMYETDILGNEPVMGDQIAEKAELYGFGDPDETPKSKQMKIEYAAAVLGMDIPTVAVLFDEIAKVRRDLGLAKMSATLPWIKEFLEGGDGDSKLVVFGYHTDVVKGLYEALAEYNPALIFGGTAVKKRQPEVNRFQEDETCRVIILNIDAGGVGYTLTKAADVAFVEGDWTPAKLLQAEDRVHRIGQAAAKIMIFYLMANGSLDARIAQSSKMKEDNINEILDT